MFESILSDIKRAIRQGNNVTRIIMFNAAVFIIINLLYVFTFHGNSGSPSAFYMAIERGLSISAQPIEILKKPWTIITHMFLHKGMWHFVWNMLLFYWFARIFADFLGDKRMLPFYILGGIAGAVVFVLADMLLPTGTHGMATAMGASAAVMAVIMATATLSPDYTMHLLLLGPVKIKYIALVILFLDIVGTAGMSNAGGHFAHLGGAMFGVLYVLALRKGTDLTQGLQNLLDKIPKIQFKSSPKKKHAKSMKVVHRKKEGKKSDQTRPPNDASFQEKLDLILDKIKEQGYDSLTDQEKDFLYQASKK